MANKKDQGCQKEIYGTAIPVREYPLKVKIIRITLRT